MGDGLSETSPGQIRMGRNMLFSLYFSQSYSRNLGPLSLGTMEINEWCAADFGNYMDESCFARFYFFQINSRDSISVVSTDRAECVGQVS